MIINIILIVAILGITGLIIYNNIKKKQAEYVILPKKDDIETSTEEVKIEEDQNWFEKILNIFKK